MTPIRIAAWLFLLPLALLAQNTPTASNQYIGSQQCDLCHHEISQQFNTNPHFKEKAGCEGCHGPGGNHMAVMGSKDTIQAFSQMSPAKIVDTCLSCHEKDFSKANIRRSEHTEADVVCTNCHSIHHSETPKYLLAKQQNQLCYSCHQSVRAQFDMPVKHRVNEGVVQCTDCHNPHGTFAASWQTGIDTHMVTPGLDNEQPCLKCHVDKRGPFVFEHASVRVEGCTACHVAHGSTNAKLLKRPVVFTICLECHNGSGTFGRENTGVVMQSASHNMLDPRYQQCTLCHVRIHGSNSDPRFLR